MTVALAIIHSTGYLYIYIAHKDKVLVIVVTMATLLGPKLPPITTVILGELDVATVAIICARAFAVAPSLPVGERKPASEGVFWRKRRGTSRWVQMQTKCAPFRAAAAVSSPALASTPTR